MNTIDKVNDMLINWNTSGTNSKHDPVFRTFTSLFKKVIKAELAKVDASNIVFNVGHYYISGFFTIGSQAYYFSISDVRWSCFDGRLLVRTAKHYKDWTGGINRYTSIKNDMFVKFFEPKFVLI